MSKILALLMVLGTFLAAADLNIYLVDVEGGQSTLIVAPSGQSLLIDTGIAGAEGRDPKRIFDLATNVAHLSKIDYLLITHYHGDHIGGVPALAKMIPIEKFLDHGELTLESDRPAMVQLWSAYKQVADGKRTILQPGDKIPITGLDVTVVAAAGKAITKPINGGGPNAALCKDAQQKPTDQDPENGSSVGILLTYNKFRFVDLGDLPWLQEQQLACPVNIARDG